MAKTSHRIFALVFAFLFFATSVATAAVVIWQVREQNKADKLSLEEGNSAKDNAANQLQTNNSNQTQEGKLKGTKLTEFTPITSTVDKLQIIDLKDGTGAEAKASDTITAHYTGAYAVNGEIFESSKDSGQPAQFPLSGVIQGWQQGVPGMKVGGKRRLIIPGSLAYGEAPEGYTPGSAGRPMGPLVFDIELVSIP